MSNKTSDGMKPVTFSYDNLSYIVGSLVLKLAQLAAGAVVGWALHSGRSFWIQSRLRSIQEGNRERMSVLFTPQPPEPSSENSLKEAMNMIEREMGLEPVRSQVEIGDDDV